MFALLHGRAVVRNPHRTHFTLLSLKNDFLVTQTLTLKTWSYIMFSWPWSLTSLHKKFSHHFTSFMTTLLKVNTSRQPGKGGLWSLLCCMSTNEVQGIFSFHYQTKHIYLWKASSSRKGVWITRKTNMQPDIRYRVK